MKKIIYFLFCVAFLMNLSTESVAQTISTIAGSSTSGYSGDGGPATSARLFNPHGVCTDAAGNCYVADAGNNCVRKVNTLGIITTFAGLPTAGYAGDGGAATAAQLDFPVGVVADAAGNVYILDADNSCVRKVNTSGIISTIAGTGTAGYSGDGGAATAAQMNLPAGIAIDAAGNLYIADVLNNRIRKINTAGVITTIAGTGATGYTGDGGPATAADAGFPYGVAVDGTGNVYIAFYYDNRIRMVNTSGVISTIAGIGSAGFSGDSGPATAAEFDGPWGIAADGPGNVYIADNNNNRIRKINTSGTISTVAGSGPSGFAGDGGPATVARLNNPNGLSVNGSGSIFIVDYLNHRIRKTNATFAGTAPVFSGGPSQTLTTCENTAASINSLLAVTDPDVGQTENWSVVSGPVHGILAAAYTTTSTGSMLTPAGLSYTPTTGYSGSDSFKVMVWDGIAADTTNVIVTVLPTSTCALANINAMATDEGIRILPNPNSGTFTLSVGGRAGQEAYVTITDVMGKNVKELMVGTNKLVSILLSPDGIYFVNVQTPDGTWSERILIAGE